MSNLLRNLYFELLGKRPPVLTHSVERVYMTVLGDHLKSLIKIEDNTSTGP